MDLLLNTALPIALAALFMLGMIATTLGLMFDYRAELCAKDRNNANPKG